MTVIIEFNPWYLLWAWVVGCYAVSALSCIHARLSDDERAQIRMLVRGQPIGWPFEKITRWPNWVKLAVFTFPAYAAPVFWFLLLLALLGLLVCPRLMDRAPDRVFDFVVGSDVAPD